jgi:alpha-ketoglutarate-dependent taurine dioxygenase
VVSETRAGRLEIAPLAASFGAVVTGVRLARIRADEWRDLYAAWLRYALLVFPGQHLRRDEQIAFARRFGRLEFLLAPVSNVKPDGRVCSDPTDDLVRLLEGNLGWHADSTYLPVQAKGAVFSAQVVPPIGGGTAWADMRAAYDALDAATRARVDTLSAHHCVRYSQGRIGHRPHAGSSILGYGFDSDAAPLRPLVKTHPETGRRALAIGRHAHDIPGLDAAASVRLLDELCDFACRPPRLYQHDWRVGDVVLWDNRCLLHRALPWDLRTPRVLWHSRIAGDPASESALA